MASAQAILSIVRAVRPKFSDRDERLAFAVHAFALADGYKLVAAGSRADEVKSPASTLPEVSLDGWRDADGNYALLYADTAGKRSAVLIKALPVDAALLVHILVHGEGSAPATVELDRQKYTSASADLVEGYKNLDDAVKKLAKAFGIEPGPAAKPRTANPASAAAESRLRSDHSPRAEPPAEPRREWRDLPDFGGDDDVIPPGFPRDLGGVPELGVGGRHPGGAYPGGMHVGPRDPMFAGRGPQRPGARLPEGPFPGVRYDPTNPAGLEGFHASDFQRGRRTHPDIMPPGPGGSSFDHMYM